MRRQRGMSLIEVLMAGTLTAVLLVPTLGILGMVSTQWDRQVSNATAVSTANQAMDFMAAEIGDAMAMEVINSTTIYFLLPADTDASGNYIPAWVSGTLQYRPGLELRFYMSNTKGNSEGGNYLWRGTRPSGGLLGGILTAWTPDEQWSLVTGTSNNRAPLYPDIQTITFTTTGLPANTVRITMTFSSKEKATTSSYTVQRDVYLANHN